MVNQAIVTPKRDAVQRACDSCRQHKQKCDGFNPCSRCSHKKVPCEYLSQNRKNYTRVIPEPGAKQNKRGPGPVDGGRRPNSTRTRARRRRGSFKTVRSDDSEEDQLGRGRDDCEDDDELIWDPPNDTDLGGNLDDDDEDDDDDEVEEDEMSISRARYLAKKARISPSLSPFPTSTDMSPKASTKPSVPAGPRLIASATVPLSSCAPSSRPSAPFSPPVQKTSYPVHNPYLSPKSNSYNPVTSNARSTIRSLPSISRSSSSTSLAEILLDISSPEYGNVVPLPLYPPSFSLERKHTETLTDISLVNKETKEQRIAVGNFCCSLSTSSSDSIGSIDQHYVRDQNYPTVIPVNHLSSPPAMISLNHAPPDYFPTGSLARPISFIVNSEPDRLAGPGGTDRDRAHDLFRDFRYLPPIETRFNGRKGQSRV